MEQLVNEKREEYALTDLGNAERFINQHGDSVRYCYEWRQWLVWDGRRWVINANAELMKLAHTTVRSIYSEAAESTNEERRRAVIKHAASSEANWKVENMLSSAKSDLVIRPDMLDQNPLFLNVANGVIDLSTGSLLPHDPHYLISKQINVDYNLNADCPKWKEFLHLVTGGDPYLQNYLQLSVGYTLTGRTDEHCLFMLYGEGSNGKTTFTETIRRLMGDFGSRMNIESFMQSWSNGRGATPDIASMAGTRFVLSSEIPENRKINESLIKDLTGGDAITARHLYEEPFTYIPTHKLWIFGNHKPQISGTDEGIWRRLRIIPFLVLIPIDQRRRMSDVLAEFQNEMPGILTWAVKGSLLWLKNGLPMVDAVQSATAEYRNEQDLVMQFLEDKCETNPDFSIDKDELYQAWRLWCEVTGEMEAAKRTKKWLTHQMTKRGYQQGGGQYHMLIGIRLKKNECDSP
jgi:putative DNA primase/helicase